MEPITNKLSVPLAIVLAGVLVAGAIIVTKYVPSESQTTGTSEQKNIKMEPITANDHILGNPNADIIIVEYSDTECPYCKEFHKILHTIIDQYGKDGKVAWVYRHFPVHSKSQKEAEATECAAELGGKSAFWDYIDRVFELTKGNDSLDPAKLYTIAAELKLDPTAFKTCLESGKYAKKIQAQYQDAINSGGTGTPHNIIVTKKGEKLPLEGAYPIESVKSILDGLLSGK